MPSHHRRARDQLLSAVAAISKMGGVLSAEPPSPTERSALQKEVNAVIAENPVVIFSKTWCGFCTRAKQLFQRLAVTPRIVELDLRDDGPHMQAILAEMTGRRTVPNIWINGKHVGGCDDAFEAYSSGELQKKLDASKL